jgi:hypothetical protein
MGKSVSSLTVLSDLFDDFALEGKVLVIGPVRVVTDTWPKEIIKWRHTAALNYTLIRVADDDPRLLAARTLARAKARANGLRGAEVEKYAQAAQTKRKHEILRELAASPSSIHYINREQVEWLVNLHGLKWPYRTVFIDESSSFKDHNSNRFKALAKVRRVPGLITRLHLLTASPAAESCMGLFSQIYLLDLGERLGKNITRYREEYFSYNKYSQQWKLREGAQDRILDKIKDITLVMRSKDYLSLEEPTVVPRYVSLSESQMVLYRRMEKESIVTLDDGTEIEAKTAAALSSKLLQMASGVLYETFMLLDQETEDMRKVRKVHHLHDAKIETLREIVESLDGEPLLVGYHHKSSFDRLMKAFPKAVAMDKEGRAIGPWNKRKIPLLLMHPQSGAHGLNMQDGGHNIVFFDLPWSYEYYDQFIGRLARQGQKNPVVVTPLIAVGTRDEDVFASLKKKEDAQERLFRTLKRLIRKFRREKLNEKRQHFSIDDL